MGNSAGRAWQLSQLVEGVSTSCNPSHGSLSRPDIAYLSACASMTQANHSVSFHCPTRSQAQAGHCVSKQLGGMMQPAVRFSLAGSSLVVARAPCAFPNLRCVRVAAYSVVWDCDPTPIFPLKSTKRNVTAILGRNAPSLRFMVRFGIFCCRHVSAGSWHGRRFHTQRCSAARYCPHSFAQQDRRRWASPRWAGCAGRRRS